MRSRLVALVAAALLAVVPVVGSQPLPRSVRAAQTIAAVSPVVTELRRIEGRLRSTRYSHVTRIDERVGRYEFDCSALASFVLAHAAPHAAAAVQRRNGRGRPVARDFHDVIAAAPTDQARDGWMRITRVADLRPGDVIAWRTPPTMHSANTGHVAFVAEAPHRIDREGRRFRVRVTDATSIPHGTDTRPRQHVSGFGAGDLTLFVEGRTGDPTAFGWYGLDARIDFRTHIALGRPTR